MKILITGGAGFIGSNFVCSALKNGYQIVNVDKLTYAGNLSNLEGCLDNKNHYFYQEDILNGDQIKNILFDHKPEIVLHMAAESHVDRSIESANEFINTNINGTYKLLDASLSYYKSLKNKNEFRFIHLSTDEVFGSLGLEGKFHEDMPYRPNSPYAASKASSDLIVRSFYKTHQLPSIIINSSNNYGPKQYPEKLIPLTIQNALQKKSLPVYGSGKQIRDWLYVQDHVDALISVINKGVIGESYCIGSNCESTNIDLVVKLCEILNELKPKKESYCNLISFVPDRLGHDFRYATDASKLYLHTGWEPTVSFDKGLYKTVDWYLKNLLLNNNLEKSKEEAFI